MDWWGAVWRCTLCAEYGDHSVVPQTVSHAVDELPKLSLMRDYGCYSSAVSM
jgi:hypothetical protein